MNATAANPPPRPSRTEMVLLRPLWAEGRASAREIHDTTEGETGWSYSATRKTLDRMEEKGLVVVEKVHGIKTYRAVARKTSTLAAMIRDFARQVLDTDDPLPVASLTGSRSLTAEELEEVERLLREEAAEGRE